MKRAPSRTHGRRSLLPEGSLCCDDIHARTPAPQTAALLAEPPAAHRPCSGRSWWSGSRSPIVAWLWSNALHNLSVRRISTGFAFLGREAGMPIADTWLAYSPKNTYLRAFIVGIVNTLRVAVDRHRAGDRARHADRHRAAVVELAAVAARRGLCRSAARHSAAAAIAVLVRADAGTAGGARRMEADRGRLSFQSGPGAAVDPDRGSEPLGDRGGRGRADRALSAAAATDRAADGGRQGRATSGPTRWRWWSDFRRWCRSASAHPGPSRCRSCAASISSAG